MWLYNPLNIVSTLIKGVVMVEFIDHGTVQDHEEVMTEINRKAEAVRARDEDEMIWFVEYPHIYTAGTQAKYIDLIDSDQATVYSTSRAGEYGYHGPGSLNVYMTLSLKQRRIRIRDFERATMDWVSNALTQVDIETQEIGAAPLSLFATQDGVQKKVAAMGFAIRRGITFHGITINVNPDLAYFNGIPSLDSDEPLPVLCIGQMDNYPDVTSLQSLGSNTTVDQLKQILEDTFDSYF